MAESTSSRLDALNTPATVSIVRFISAALLLCLLDQRNQTLTLIGRHLVFSRMQMRSECFFQRAAKKRLQHALKCSASGLAFGLARNIDHLPTALPSSQISLFFQDVHHSSNRHRCRRRGNGFDDFVHSRLPKRKDSIHDLSLASTECRWVRHHSLLQSRRSHSRPTNLAARVVNIFNVRCCECKAIALIY